MIALDFHESEWAKVIGQQAALIKYAGQSDDYVKRFVESQLPYSELSEAKSLQVAWTAYRATMKRLANLPLNGYLAAFNTEGEIICFEPNKIDRVQSAYWLKKHLPQHPRNYCRNTIGR